jgi:hypothetical protein
MRWVWVLFLIGVSETSFGAFRCGNQLVALGDTRYEVETICGEPDDASSHTYYRSLASQEVVDCEPVRTVDIDALTREPDEEPEPPPRSCLALVENRLAVRVDVDVWLYDLGRNRFMQEVTFENGRVTHIEALDYGKKSRR